MIYISTGIQKLQYTYNILICMIDNLYTNIFHIILSYNHTKSKYYFSTWIYIYNIYTVLYMMTTLSFCSFFFVILMMSKSPQQGCFPARLPLTIKKIKYIRIIYSIRNVCAAFNSENCLHLLFGYLAWHYTRGFRLKISDKKCCSGVRFEVDDAPQAFVERCD